MSDLLYQIFGSALTETEYRFPPEVPLILSHGYQDTESPIVHFVHTEKRIFSENSLKIRSEWLKKWKNTGNKFRKILRDGWGHWESGCTGWILNSIVRLSRSLPSRRLKGLLILTAWNSTIRNTGHLVSRRKKKVFIRILHCSFLTSAGIQQRLLCSATMPVPCSGTAGSLQARYSGSFKTL